jgi:tetratricopeptide (TPR) repeat protein
VIGLLLAATVLSGCLELRLSGDPESAQGCYLDIIRQAESPLDVAAAYEAVGDRRSASETYRVLLEQQPERVDVRLAWGDLFARVHQDGDAQALYQEILDQQPDHFAARLALARLYLDHFDGPTAALVGELRKERPQAAGPMLIESRLALEIADFAKADALLAQLGALSAPSLEEHLETLALQSASALLQGRSENPALTQLGNDYPHYGGADALAAHFHVITRRYREAVALLESAVARDPQLWHAHSDLGQNLLRLNRLADARRHLELAYEGDPYNAITVNTLRLMDTLEGFPAHREEFLLLRAPADEAAALIPTVSALAADAVASMAPRYGYVFEREMVIEMFAHHDDFAVRTAGLPGIGILGAAFGDVVVMNGPSARTISEGFDWASALWHEMAHVVTLNATDNLVSRWFSEGVSVFEEWRYGPSRRSSLPLSFLQAWHDGKLLPVAELDEGFIRPSYEGQIMVSYVQAGLICMLIADNFVDGIARVLREYRDGDDSNAALTDGLGVSLAQIDELLEEYLTSRYGAVANSLAAFRQHVSAAGEAAQQENWQRSLEQAEAAIALYPDYVEPGSPYVTAVTASAKLDDFSRMEQLGLAYFRAGGREPAVLEPLVKRLTGEMQLAVAQTLAITLPLRGDVRSSFGEALLAAGLTAQAASEFEVALALAPHDRAEAHYQLARALAADRQLDRARREVLLALEIAPRYSAALRLLLQLQEQQEEPGD